MLHAAYAAYEASYPYVICVAAVLAQHVTRWLASRVAIVDYFDCWFCSNTPFLSLLLALPCLPETQLWRKRDLFLHRASIKRVEASKRCLFRPAKPSRLCVKLHSQRFFSGDLHRCRPKLGMRPRWLATRHRFAKVHSDLALSVLKGFAAMHSIMEAASRVYFLTGTKPGFATPMTLLMPKPWGTVILPPLITKRWDFLPRTGRVQTLYPGHFRSFWVKSWRFQLP